MADIHIEVANALHFALAIPAHKVMAEVKGGVVTLRGVVDRAYQKSFAEAIARGVPGVVDVRNNIAIDSPVELSLPTLHH